MKSNPSRLLSVILLTAATCCVAVAGTEPLTFQDLMRFRQIDNPVISRDGAWIAYAARPDRGEGEVVARQIDTETEYHVQRGRAPVLSGDSRWLACAILPTQKERDEAAEKKQGAGKSEKKDDDGPRNGLALVSLADGEETRFEEVESFAFSDDGRWIAWKRYKPRKDEDEEKPAEEKEETEAPEVVEEDDEDEDRPLGTVLVLRDLERGTDIEIPHVMSFAFDEPSRHLAYATAGPGGEINGAYVRLLDDDTVAERALHTLTAARVTHLTWAEDSSLLAFVAAVDDEDHEPGPADLWFWDGGERGKARRLAASADAPEGRRIPSKNSPAFSRDGERLFFGYEWIDPVREERRLKKKDEKREERERKAAEKAGDPVEEEEEHDPYNSEELLDRRGVDVWHWNDPYIIPNQKKRWKETEKDRTYLAVIHLDSGKIVRLADREVPDAAPSDNPRSVLARSNLAYRKETTWDGEYADVYHVDLRSGKRRLVAPRLRNPAARLSPDGRFVAYWNDLHWHLFDADTGATRNLTAKLAVPFANEDDDYPAPDPGYGIADWVEGDRAVLIYDKFDVWRFATGNGRPVNLTAGKGREESRQFRVIDLDPKRDFILKDERLLLHAYHDRRKNHGFWQTRGDRESLRRLVEEEAGFRFLAKAEDSDEILYTRETYNEFPDLWVADGELQDARKLSRVNPQIERFAWGTAELVEWTSMDGLPLQGVLIKPGNYEPGRRYPVLVYFYRFFSQRLHSFNEPVINHRPSFPIYASNGYAVFLPDIRFEIGRPGLSAVKALVPGVQKLVDLGVADPEAIGLHGHSWSGYQAAHVVTQTDIFAAAVAGAPVSNMTSAYSGIRLGSGRARQFQYEQSQSRIGGSLDAELPKYLENSPVFHVRHINTPLLIQFGDQDEAVPWQQGIELYLAMRRLEKNVIFLQYRGEPHHLKKYPNKLDYSIKMKQFFDHHLLDAPAPEWMTEGVPYRGE